MTASLAPAPTDQKLRVVVASATDEGGRTGNEDAVLVQELAAVGSGEGGSEAGFLLAVADGMGGHQQGEVASEIAIAAVREMFAEDPGGDTALLLKQAFRRANERIFAAGQGATPAQIIGTTLVVAATRGKYATIASIGDSRAYLLRASRLNQITKDHSVVAEMVAQGVMSADEARNSPRRNVLTHALGQRAKLDAKMPNIFEIVLLPEDRLLICTDGFFDVLPDEELRTMVLDADPDGVAQRLVDVAVERGTTDNVSAVVASVLPAREPTALPVEGAGARGVPLYVLPLVAAVILLIIILVLVVL